MRGAALVAIAASGCVHADPYEQAIDATRDTWPYYEAQPYSSRSPWARPLSSEQLARQIQRSFYAGAPELRGLSSAELRAQVAAALAIDYLLDGFDDRPFSITPISSEDRGGYVWHRAALADPFVVGLAVDYLVPTRTSERGPAVVGLHGHFDDGVAFLESYLGVELASLGYVVAAPTFRHMDCGDDERDQAIALMRDGFTLMGQRVYEAMLAMKLVRSLDGVDPLRIGLMGHSGGSSTANLLVRLSDWPVAVVTDHEVEFRNTCGGKVHCETVPALLPLAADVNDGGTLRIPHLRIDYGYTRPDQRDAALELLAASLNADTSR